MEMVRLNDFEQQWQEIGSAALAAVNRVGRSGWLILGNEVSRFEAQLAGLMGKKHAVGCANGMDAIEIGLRVLGLQEGDHVLTTPISAFATTLAILRAKGVPVFVDVDESGLLDLEKTARFLEASASPPLYLLPVHLYGQSLNLEALAGLRDRFRLKVIEDCAQSLGATSGQRLAGSVGDIAALSFYPTKILGCMGDGGALLMDAPEHTAQAKALRNYGQTSKYRHELIGMNSRLDELQAALMTDALLPLLSGANARRKSIASMYRASITHPLITIPLAPTESQSSNHLFPILVEGNRGSLQLHLGNQGIETAIHYPLTIPDQPSMRGVTSISVGGLEVARRFVARELSLPIHPYLKERDLERVVNACNSWDN